MAGEALFLGWGQVARGREQLALEVFQETVAYYGKLQEDGKIERFDAYLLEPHGGDLTGFAPVDHAAPLAATISRSCAPSPMMTSTR